ncbi:MAG: hypothetical protein RIQ81_1631 [Pseudomonadota bacterium]|jgi:AGZA family xanthine/uracil permease-like MFS transporter
MSMKSLSQFADRFFALRANQTTIQTEVRAGLTTFLTMAYIIFVNPSILGNVIKIPGVDLRPELLTTTAIATALATTLVALIGKYPFAIAPGMGLNAYFAFSVVAGQGVPWQTALGGVFISGVVFLVISVARIRELIFTAIPMELKLATAGGIGMFLAMIGFTNSGIVADHPATLVTLGNLASKPVVVSLVGIIVTTALMARRVKGSILIGIATATILAIATGAPVFEGKPFQGFPDGIIAAPVWPKHLFLAMDLKGAMALGLVHIVFTFTMIELFDTAGTLVGISQKAGLMDSKGNLPRASRVFAADATANMAGAVLGTSPMTTYIESAAGIEEGGKTGLTALTVALLFAASIIFWPLASVIPAHATAPAMIVVGCMMMGSLAKVSWGNLLTALPAFLTMVLMPLTYSISNGIAGGILSWCALHLLTGQARKVHWIMYLLAGMLLLKVLV